MVEETKKNKRTYESLWLNTQLCVMTDYKYRISTNSGWWYSFLCWNYKHIYTTGV